MVLGNVYHTKDKFVNQDDHRLREIIHIRLWPQMVTLRELRERGELGQLCVSEQEAGHEVGVAAPDEGHHQDVELLSGYKIFYSYL